MDAVRYGVNLFTGRIVTMSMKMYYIANARMPSEKAHGIQIAKMCEAFIEAGVDLTLIVPRRATDPRSLQDYYNLRVPIPLVRLYALDWYTSGSIGYFLSSVTFMCSYLFFIWSKKRAGERPILYTVDIDNYSSSVLAFLGLPIFSEMHGAKPHTLAQHLLFKKASGIIAINKIIIRELQKNFPRSPARYLVEPNGVDLSSFRTQEKQAARTKLGLPDTKIVLYAGRFFAWKGLEILPQAASATPTLRWQMVGGNREEFEKIAEGSVPSNMYFAGSRPHEEMPLWLSAADALIVLGTVRDTQSYRYTSPMKLFEYLAVGRPIIASNTPAICEVVSSKEVSFYEPDNVQDLARAIEHAIANPFLLVEQIEAARHKAVASSWQARAERIKQFIQETTPSHV